MSSPGTLSAATSPALYRLRMRSHNNTRTPRWLALLVGILIAPSAASAGIVTTLPPLAGIVRMLDPVAEVHCLLPPGADAHDFQLTPRQVEQLRQADLLLRSSYDDGHWSGIRASRAGFDMWPKRGHAWLSPEEVRERLPALAAVLQRLAPGRRAVIAAALKKAERSCDAVDAAWKKALAPYRKAGVIMQHNAWQAMLQHDGVPVWVVLESGHGAESITPQRLQKALDALNAHPGAVLWGNRRHSDRALRWLQEQQSGANKARLLILDPIGECGMDWLQLMQRNLDLLAGKAAS